MTWLGSDAHWGALVALLVVGVVMLSDGPHRHHRAPHRKLRIVVGHLRLPCSDVPNDDGSVQPATEPLSRFPVAGPQLQAGLSRLDRGAAVTTTSETPHPAPGESGLPGAGLLPRIAVDAGGTVLPPPVSPSPSYGGPGHELEAPLSAISETPRPTPGGSAPAWAAQTADTTSDGLGPKQPVDGRDPRLQPSTGPQLPAMAQPSWEPHPRGEEAGATSPRLAAPAPLLHDYPHRSIA